MSAPIIALLTDFGEGSLYEAEMKGSILSVNPQVRLVDLTHTVPPQFSLFRLPVTLDHAAIARRPCGF